MRILKKLNYLVGVAGFEPAASSSRKKVLIGRSQAMALMLPPALTATAVLEPLLRRLGSGRQRVAVGGQTSLP
jgi:hypothetical protein